MPRISKRARFWAVFTTLFLAAFVLRVALGWYVPNIYWPDEITPTLETAHDWVFGYGLKSWEHTLGLRSGIAPLLLAGVMWVTEPLGAGSTGYLFSIISLLSFFSLVPALIAFLWARRRYGRWLALVAAFVPLAWMELVFFAPKAFYEVLTAHLLIVALYLGRFADGTTWRPVTAGILLGLVCMMRLQLAPAAFAFLISLPLWCDYPHRRFTHLVVGLTIGAAISGISDAFIWGAPFQSTVTNYYTNLIQGTANTFGTWPEWQYLVWMWEINPVGSTLLVVAVLLGTARFPTLTWPAIAIFVAHSAIGHKEYRFIYPAIAIGVIPVGLWAANALATLQDKWPDRRFVWPAACGLGFALLLGLSSVHAATNFELRSLGHIHAEETNWTEFTGFMLAFRHISQMSDVCGVGLSGNGLMYSGSFSYLHKDVPVVLLYPRPQLDRILRQHHRAVDVIVTTRPDDVSKLPGNYAVRSCRFPNEVCILQRPGSCQIDEDTPVHDRYIEPNTD